MLQAHMHELQQRRLAEEAAEGTQTLERVEDDTDQAFIQISAEAPISEPEQPDNQIAPIIKVPSVNEREREVPEARAIKSDGAPKALVRPQPEPQTSIEPIRHPVEATAVIVKDSEDAEVEHRVDDLVKPQAYSLDEGLNSFSTVMVQESDVEVSEAPSTEVGLLAYDLELDEEATQSEDITEVYDILIAVINARSDRRLDAAFEASDEIHKDMAVSTVHEGEAAEQTRFEEYIASVPPLENTPNLEYISSMAQEEQPLEETLAQLAIYLEYAPKDEALTIKQLLAEIEKELPIDRAEDQPVETILTKEITQKLLSLLREVGYEEPERTLFRFFASHDLDFMLQAIKYLHQLTNDDNQQEAKHFSLTSLMAGNSRSTQFANIIFALIAGKLGIKAGI